MQNVVHNRKLQLPLPNASLQPGSLGNCFHCSDGIGGLVFALADIAIGPQQTSSSDLKNDALMFFWCHFGDFLVLVLLLKRHLWRCPKS